MTDRPYRMRVGAVVSVSNAEPRKLRYPAFVRHHRTLMLSERKAA